MVRSCCAINCKQRMLNGFRFFTFPKDVELQKKWIIAMKRDKWQPRRDDLLCAKHFTPEDIDNSLMGQTYKCKRLKKDAVPSIFNFPPHLMPRKAKTRTTKNSNKENETDKSEQPNVDQAKKPVIEQSKEMDSVDQVEKPVIEKSKELEMEPFEEPVTPEPRERKRRYFLGDFKDEESVPVNLVKKLIAKKNKVLRTTRKVNKRLKLKVRKMSDLIQMLCILEESGHLEANKLRPLLKGFKGKRFISSRKKLHRRFETFCQNLKQDDSLHLNTIKNSFSERPGALQEIIQEKFKQYKFENTKLKRIRKEHSKTMKKFQQELELKKMEILHSKKAQIEKQLLLRDQHDIKIIYLRAALEIRKAELEKIKTLNNF